MIAKSMSRKTPSFDQLAAYMNSEKADDAFDLYQNCLARGETHIAEAFLKNSQHLRSRKNANYLYHEILSISLEPGVDRNYAKECLREIALEYVSKRCPRNMVYGCLHDDHSDHLHYHLMISANVQHQADRLRLTKSQFDTIKRDLEIHVLENYPQLKQRTIITASSDEKKNSHKASKQKQRTGKLERQEEVRASIAEAMSFTSSLEDFKTYLEKKHSRFYTRGKHYGVEVTHDTGKVAKYRFATIGVHEDFENYLAALDQFQGAQEAPEQAQDGHSKEKRGFEDTDGSASSEKPQAEENIAGEKEKERKSERADDFKSSKSEFQRDMENIYAKKREKAAHKKTLKLKRKPRSR